MLDFYSKWCYNYIIRLKGVNMKRLNELRQELDSLGTKVWSEKYNKYVTKMTYKENARKTELKSMIKSLESQEQLNKIGNYKD